MKHFIIVCAVAILLFGIGCSKCEESGGANITLETEKQKASYAVGYNMGMNIKNMADEVDLDIVVQGMKDAATGQDEKIPAGELQKILRDFYASIREKMQEKRRVQAEKNKTEGEAFLAENAKKEGVKVTKTGLQYLVLKEGDGPKPKATDQVKVHYNGTIIDGTEFDSSYKRNEPAVFPLNRVIPAWQEGLQLMSVGSKYKFFVPSDLAYKERGNGPVIGPNAVLIFEVELLSIEPPAPKPEGPKKAK
jgi:FKBP-type peptidyl-prolyl cis-trans isomerase